MRKKRLAASLLALSLCFSLAACSGGSSAPADTTAPESAAPAETTPAETAPAETAAESDLSYVQTKGTLVVGITNFAPMDYKAEGSEEWIGFDADMAKAFAESLGVAVEFQEITWDYKVMELDAKNIDAVWNGMTLNDEVMAAMSTSVPYCTNYQTLIYKADRAADFEGLTSLEGLNVAVESGSAGEDAAEALGAVTVPVQSSASSSVGSSSKPTGWPFSLSFGPWKTIEPSDFEMTAKRRLLAPLSSPFMTRSVTGIRSSPTR